MCYAPNTADVSRRRVVTPDGLSDVYRLGGGLFRSDDEAFIDRIYSVMMDLGEDERSYVPDAAGAALSLEEIASYTALLPKQIASRIRELRTFGFTIETLQPEDEFDDFRYLLHV